MVRFLGFVFIALVLSALTVSADYWLPGNYLNNFLNEHFVETFSVLIGFNIASVTFLLGQLLVIEERVDHKYSMNATRTEIKHNAYFLLGAFLSSILILTLRPDLNVNDFRFTANLFFYILNTLVITIFNLSIFSIFEILRAVFRLSKT